MNVKHFQGIFFQFGKGNIRPAYNPNSEAQAKANPSGTPEGVMDGSGIG